MLNRRNLLKAALSLPFLPALEAAARAAPAARAGFMLKWPKGWKMQAFDEIRRPFGIPHWLVPNRITGKLVRPQ